MFSGLVVYKENETQVLLSMKKMGKVDLLMEKINEKLKIKKIGSNMCCLCFKDN